MHLKVLSCFHCLLRFDWHSLNNVISLHSVLRWFIATRVGNNYHQLQSQQTNIIVAQLWMETIDSAYFLAVPTKYVFIRFYRSEVLRFKLIVALKYEGSKSREEKLKSGDDLRTFYGL